MSSAKLTTTIHLLPIIQALSCALHVGLEALLVQIDEHKDSRQDSFLWMRPRRTLKPLSSRRRAWWPRGSSIYTLADLFAELRVQGRYRHMGDGPRGKPYDRGEIGESQGGHRLRGVSGIRYHSILLLLIPSGWCRRRDRRRGDLRTTFISLRRS